MRRKTTEEFIEEAKKVHGDRYDYSLVEYKTVHDKVIITCKSHGIFEQRPNCHLKGQGCSKCAIKKQSERQTKTTKQFIEESVKIHGNKYNYSEVNYEGSHVKVKIICKTHNEIFEQKPNDHLTGYGCKKCGIETLSKLFRNTIEEFIKRAKQIHGNKYDYDLVNYINNHTKIKIKCKIHGIFEQSPYRHLNSLGCSKCYGNIRSTTEEFIEKSIKIHGKLYDYFFVEYANSHTKVKIICKVHGIFDQTPSSHLNNRGCPICKSSKGELRIKDFLDSLGIKYETQKTFDRCKNKRRLPFDFYLSKFNICIEFDGKQHFVPIKFYGGGKGFNETQIRDKIKIDYCKNNNIPLYRIRYDENIEEKLNIILQKYLLSQ